MSSFTKTDEGRAAALSLQSLKRIAQPDDIGDVIAFLAGDTVRVDGGSKL
jgi:3-oxoacyl-[acyl-carrier protein] reductase